VGSGDASLDADRVQQIIGNLVANSVAYGDLQRPITITSRLGGGACEVAVHNDGAVIPEALLAVLFEPMTRGTDQGSEVRSVGLGLYIVRELAKVHGGDVAVRSCATGGTTFTVTFQYK
jgi:phosphoserine phosphatase RsbU/P